jgi:hypothetical protein
MFEQKLPPELEALVWHSYFSKEVLPLLKRDLLAEMVDHACEAYCHTEEQALNLRMRVEKDEESLRDLENSGELIMWQAVMKRVSFFFA